MQEVILALIAGFAVGIFFSFLKLPIPAPPVLSGIMGIVGVYLGGITYLWIIERFFTQS
ncbi:XapX domain-containing protein [Thalassotalea crassostreae]|uniref:XapX domain-containing protein n=1 Tax=Thalassotalea crassostreae TaxID=1763536 RepID=UPI000838F182|nr:XapX domain-containing protein [Thalassotalea crassostreae]